jgi:hypothetical protein
MFRSVPQSVRYALPSPYGDKDDGSWNEKWVGLLSLPYLFIGIACGDPLRRWLFGDDPTLAEKNDSKRV